MRAFSSRLNPGGGRGGTGSITGCNQLQSIAQRFWLPWNGVVSSVTSPGYLDLSLQERFALFDASCQTTWPGLSSVKCGTGMRRRADPRFLVLASSP